MFSSTSAGAPAAGTLARCDDGNSVREKRCNGRGRTCNAVFNRGDVRADFVHFFVEFRFDGFELFVFVNFLTALVVSLDFGDALLFVERDPYDKR